MSDELALRASDADRERTVAALREHSAQGRLTLEEFAARMSAACEARTQGELDALVGDLPAAAPVPRRRTRFLLSIFGSSVRGGRLRLPRRVVCATVFGNVDLDLREATLERGVLTVYVLGVFGTADVYVPEAADADLHGLAIFGHARANGDYVPRPDAPVVRVVSVSVFAGIDLWRVPFAWRQRPFREVIRGIRSGGHRELGA
jgi:hypothetical protein